jgi:hypothetical protein
MNWEENKRTLAQLAGDAAYEEDPDFLAILPAAVTFAENQILRDLDLLSTVVEDNSGTVTQNRRRFILPTSTGTFIVLSQILPIVNGVQYPPLLPTSPETIDALFPSEIAPSQPSIPQYWAPLDQAAVLVAPPPDANYSMLVRGTMRPASLNPQSSNGTFISTQLVDLFIAAEASFLIGGWQKNWAPQGQDPTSAMGWMQEYEKRKNPALVEELRKKLQSNGWGSRLPSPVASPPQT